MATLEALPLEIRYMIVEYALPNLVVQTPSGQRFERDYCKAVLRIATTSHLLLSSVCYLIELLKRQHDEPERKEGHNDFCIVANACFCVRWKWCLLDSNLQSLLRVSRGRDDHYEEQISMVPIYD